jgi:hypothetical protein
MVKGEVEQQQGVICDGTARDSLLLFSIPSIKQPYEKTCFHVFILEKRRPFRYCVKTRVNAKLVAYYLIRHLSL